MADLFRAGHPSGTGWWLLLLLILIDSDAWAAVETHLERSQVYQGESVNLTIEVDGHQEEEPDLIRLEPDFQVLGVSTGREVRIINGQRSDKTRWTIRLEPKRLGRLEIPPISIAGQQTRTLVVDVREVPEQLGDRADRRLFLEVEVEPNGRPPWVQEQILYTVRLLYDLPLLSGELSDPKVPDAVIERLTKDRHFQTRRHGRDYRVVERSYAVFPEKSGELVLPSLRFDGRVATERRGRPSDPAASLLERFLRKDNAFTQGFGGGSLSDDLFMMTPFADRGQRVSIRSKAVQLEVAGRPENYTDRYWLPAREVRLRDSWADNPPRLTVGEPVTRTITIETKGLEASHIPQLELQPPSGVKLYPERPVNGNRTDGRWLYGNSRQSFTYVPTAPGLISLSAVEISWWDAEEGRKDTASVPGWQLQVAGQAVADNGAATGDPISQPRQGEVSGGSHGPVDRPGPTTPNPMLRYWPWVLIAGLILGALLVVVWRRRRQETSVSAVSVGGASGTRPQQLDRESLLEALEQACSRHNPQAASQALVALGACLWPERPPRNLVAFATRLETGEAEIIRLDRALYAPDGGDWDGRALIEVVRDAIGAQPEDASASVEPLDPLYPQRA